MSSEITTWEDSQRLRHLAQALKQMLPNGSKLSDGEALALAQAAVAMGRNPLAGEIYAIPGKGVTDGYRGLMKDARPGSYHLRSRPLTAEEVAEHGVRPVDNARACELYMFHEMEQCKRFGIPYEPTIGIGIVREEERFQCEVWDDRQRRKVLLPREKWVPIDPPTGRSWAWKAEIRAMKDALRRAGVAYVDPEEVAELRQRAEALGVDTRGAESAAQIAALVEQQAYLAEQSAARAEQTEQVVAVLGGDEETREEAARLSAQQATDDLFGEEKPAGFWKIPDAWVTRLMEKVNQETGGHYNHAKHLENALRKEGFTAVTRDNVVAARDALIARVKQEAVQPPAEPSQADADPLWDDVIPDTAFQP